MAHHTALDPVVVEGPAPIKPLTSALIKLNDDDDTAQIAHFEPRQLAALREYVAELEQFKLFIDSDLYAAKVRRMLYD